MVKLVEINSIKEPITKSPGFAKKHLSNAKIDLLGLCEFGCLYCSSNSGNYLRINRTKFQAETQKQLGQPYLPHDTPDLMFVWPDVLERLESQLNSKSKDWGSGQTLMFSMLTDGFSPYLVKHGITRRALEMILENTSFRIRVLTKNAIVGSTEWLDFFSKWGDRFVVGLSIGSSDNDWARRIEKGTSIPSARIKALHRLQQANIKTFGMACPILPDAYDAPNLENLIGSMNPNLLETIWAEPFNDRSNWSIVRDGYGRNSSGYLWMTEIYENGDRQTWSSYACSLYERLILIGKAQGWDDKVKYLLYENDITESDAKKLAPFKHILFQGPNEDGLSTNPHIRKLQLELKDDLVPRAPNVPAL